jgi:hypothetical protein
MSPAPPSTARVRVECVSFRERRLTGGQGLAQRPGGPWRACGVWCGAWAGPYRKKRSSGGGFGSNRPMGFDRRRAKDEVKMIGPLPIDASVVVVACWGGREGNPTSSSPRRIPPSCVCAPTIERSRGFRRRQGARFYKLVAWGSSISTKYKGGGYFYLIEFDGAGSIECVRRAIFMAKGALSSRRRLVTQPI